MPACRSGRACSVTEAAQRLDVSPARVWQLIHDKRLPRLRFKRRTLIPIISIKHFAQRTTRCKNQSHSQANPADSNPSS